MEPEQQQQKLLSKIGGVALKLGAKAGVATVKTIAGILGAKAIAIAGAICLAVLLIFILIHAVVSSPATMASDIREAVDNRFYDYRGDVISSIFHGSRIDWTAEDEEKWFDALRQIDEAYKEDLPNPDCAYQQKQAEQYALPWGIVASVENYIYKVLDHNEDFEPNPLAIYESLKTDYTFGEETSIDYTLTYEYFYSYSYSYDVEITDDEGETTTETRHNESSNYPELQDGGEVHFPTTHSTSDYSFENEVELLTDVDAYDDTYTIEYESSRETIQDIHVANDPDAATLGISLVDIVEDDIERRIHDNIRSGAYGINIDYDYEILESSKTYLPLKQVSAENNDFDRLKEFFQDEYNHELVFESAFGNERRGNLDSILHAAADYDPDIAYKLGMNPFGAPFTRGATRSINLVYDGVVSTDLYWPVEGEFGARGSAENYITSPFGWRGTVYDAAGNVRSRASMHHGIDVGSIHSDHSQGIGPPILSAADGHVISSGYRGGGGNTLTIDHGTDMEGRSIRTVYMHLHSYVVEASDDSEVSAGEKIGYMGTTGQSTGVHLHFEVHIDGQPVDPMSFRYIK